MHAKIWMAIGGAALAWGTTGVATRAALEDGVPPVAMVAIRAVIAAVVLYGLLRLRRRPVTTDRYRWATGLIAGVFQLSVPFVLFTLAYQYASAGFGGLFAALIPLATAVLAHFLLPDERLHGRKVVGLMLAFAGVAVLLASGDSGLATGGRPLLAAALSMGAVVSVAYAGVVTKRRGGSADPLELTFMQFVFGVVLIGTTMLVSEGIPGSISAWGWTLVVYLAIFGSIVPFLLFYWVLHQVSSTQASLIGYVVPLVAITAGIVLLDERLQLGIAAGGVLILVGVVLTDRSERARLAHT